MLEIASQMILCLLLAALLGFIIGYLFGKGTCPGDSCNKTAEVTHDNAHGTDEAHNIASEADTSIEIENTNTVSTHISNPTNIPTESSNEDNKPVLLSEARNGEKDNLTRIKGIGLKIEEALNNIGIYHFDQIAAWDTENIAWADKTLGFPGRAEREQWVAQAKALNAGEETEFSKRVDAGKVSSSKKS